MAHHIRNITSPVGASLVALGILLSGVYPYPATAAPTQTVDFSINPLEDYLLGPGDVLFVEVVNLPEEITKERKFRIALDGSIALPLAGRLMVAGKTIPQVQQEVLAAYDKIMRYPAVTVALETPRPLRILVSGEVKRPGTYNLRLDNTGEWPTLTRFLSEAGGITQSADVRNVEVRRSLGQGRTAVTKVNLWDMIQSGDASQDLTVRSDDVIVIPKVEVVNAAEAVQIASANFSPVNIPVQVIGEVIRPGLVQVPANATLNQALGAAGGFNMRRANRGSVVLVRLDRDGNVTKRTIPVNLADNPNDVTNPVLRENDIVMVGRSGLTQLGDSLGDVLQPLNSLGSLTLFLRIFGDL